MRAGRSSRSWRVETVAALAAVAAAGCGERAPEAPREAEAAPFAVAGAGAPSRGGQEGRPSEYPGARAAAPRERPAGRWETARVVRRTALRSRPAGRVLGRIGRRTEFGSRRVLAVAGRRGGWLRVIASELGNGEHAWVRAAAMRPGATDVSLHVDRSRRELTLRRGRRVLRRVTVAVGRPDTPTPLGRFAVTDRLRARRADSPYGCCAIALSGHQTKLLPGWPGGDRLAIHGTPQPETIGQAVSLGCMRASRADLKVLMHEVPLGAPVFIRR